MPPFDAVSFTLAAKALVALVFLANALGIVDQVQPERDMEGVGVPHPLAHLATGGGRGFQLVACVGLFTPWDRWAALALALFLIPATLLAHHFWGLPPADQSRQLTQFLKNAAIVGGLLGLAVRR